MTHEKMREMLSKDEKITMTSKDIIDTMAAELYKLNDINKQKMLTMKYTVRAFSVTLISLLIGIIICKAYGDCVNKASKYSNVCNQVKVSKQVKKLWPTSENGKIKFLATNDGESYLLT